MAAGGGADFTQLELLLLLLSEDRMLKELSEEALRLLSFAPR